MRVLVVDDSFTVREYYRAVLKDVAEVDEAVNGFEALEKAFVESYDLFLVDVNMPKMDGYHLTEELRQSGVDRPIIMISTEREDQDRKKGLSRGATLYLVKPVRPEQLQFYVRLLG
ncbi:MAG: response regulator [Desulfofundulus sp.]|uniref:response regulator n=1 Tax=Desulfofundulus sp. TaxID=2282750 RepID=UPI003C70813E